MMFKGLYTAIITPFEMNENGKTRIDFSSLENILNNQINSNVKGIVVAGSTGEIPTLNEIEYEELLEFCSAICKNKLQIIAGIGTNNTENLKKLSNLAYKYKYDGVMSVVPFYNKPSQEGIYKHFEFLNDVTKLPVMLYTVTSRTGVDFSDETLVRLSFLENIYAVKDASGELEKPLRLKNKVKDGFSFISGEDGTAVEYNQNGGVGCVSVASNIIPEVVNLIQLKTEQNDFNKAYEIQDSMSEFFKMLFLESNPVGVKYIMSKFNLCKEYVRLPLVPLKKENKDIINNFLSNFNILLKKDY